MDWLIHLPAYVKVGGAFAGILVLNWRGVPLGVAILLFSLLLTLWTGTGADGLRHQLTSFLEPRNYLLPVLILLLLFFTESLNRTGRMERTIAALKEWLRSRHIILAGLPALVGLLPMPAGALFSAPFVAAVDERKELSPPHKTAINYWFRHIWEYWWPLYPGVILAMQYSGLPAALYFLIQVPFTVAALAGGYFFILRQVKAADGGNPGYGAADAGGVLSALGPIGLLVGISLIGSGLLPLWGVKGAVANLVAMLAGLVVALCLIFSGHAAAFRPSLRMLRSRNTWLMMVLIIGILSFSSALLCPLDRTGTTLITTMRDEFVRTGIPVITVIMLIPFISGMVTGVAFGFVGASFPIVFALVGPHPTPAVAAATTSFAYTFGYMGMMLSPMHACFVVSAEYFGTRIYETYRYIAGPALVMLVSATLLAGLYSVMF